uniref:Uncharacterized protein n=1 Tax=Setaria viridis TaxID=4556 RepID=A0A4U6U3G8_SETVI|nr:hypothetical protein SEVIR_6G104771v2 [Setaria viridis]
MRPWLAAPAMVVSCAAPHDDDDGAARWARWPSGGRP